MAKIALIDADEGVGLVLQAVLKKRGHADRWLPGWLPP